MIGIMVDVSLYWHYCVDWMGRGTKAKKCQVKQVKTMLDQPNRSANDKLRLLNKKYL
jgi:hypothetical protein